MAALQIGSFVVLQGLFKAPQFNGITGVIVKDKNADERWGVQLLDHAGEESAGNVNLCGGRVLGVREVNIQYSMRDSPHWRFDESLISGGLSLLERIRNDSRLSRMHNCYDFAKALWGCFFETIPGLYLTIDHGLEARKLIIGADGRKVYFLELEAIQHYLIVEKCRGRYRIYQAYIKDKNIPRMGYTAGEWCTLGRLPTSMKVHTTYGGGLTVGEREMNQLLDWILELQKVTKLLIPHLLKHVEGIDPLSMLLLAKDPQRLSPDNFERAAEAMKAATDWSHQVNEKVGPLGITNLDEFADPVVINQGPRGKLLFEIPQKLFRRAHALNEKLTGQVFLHPVVFVRMVNTGIWWENCKSPDDGGAVGFTIRIADLGVTMSYEQGIAAAKEKSEAIRRSFGGN